MKRAAALILAGALLLSACAPQADRASDPYGEPSRSRAEEFKEQEVTNAEELRKPAAAESADKKDDSLEFDGTDDPRFLQYVEDTIHSCLADELDGEDYTIEDVSAVYYSKEYLDEVAYNSQSNIFFGYTLAELDEQFQGERYVFTLGDGDETVVQAFEPYDDTLEQFMKDKAIVTGVILILVTITAINPLSGTAAATDVVCILTAGLSKAAIFAVKGIPDFALDKAFDAVWEKLREYSADA